MRCLLCLALREPLLPTRLALVPFVHLCCAACSGLVLAAKVLRPLPSGGLALSVSPGELLLHKPTTFSSSLSERLWKRCPCGMLVCLCEVSPSRLGALNTLLLSSLSRSAAASEWRSALLPSARGCSARETTARPAGPASPAAAPSRGPPGPSAWPPRPPGSWAA